MEAKDTRFQTRIDHIVNNHQSWPDKLLHLCLEKFRDTVGDPLAKAYEVAKLQPTGDSVVDQRLLAYKFVALIRAPFSMVNSLIFQSICKFMVSISRQNLIDAGNTLVTAIRKTISDELPNAFGIIFDGWDGPIDYFQAVYVVWGTDNVAQYRLLGIRSFNSVTGENVSFEEEESECESLSDDESVNSDMENLNLASDNDDCSKESIQVEPVTVHDFQRTAPAHIALIGQILKDYKKTWQNVAFMICDNCSVNQAIARQTNKPMIGCHAHLFNLACKNFYDKYKDTWKKVLQLMNLLKRKNAVKKYIKYWTGTVPKIMSHVRWRSIAAMLKSYVAIRTSIPFHAMPVLLPLNLTPSEDSQVDELLFAATTDLITVLDLLESSKANLALSRRWFQTILKNVDYALIMQEYLGDSTSLSSPLSQAFIRAVCNLSLPLHQRRPLSDEESEAVMSFKNQSSLSASRFCLSLEEEPDYPSLAWVPATSCCVERLFSCAKHYVPYTRNAISNEHFETQLMVGIYDGNVNIAKNLDVESGNGVNSID